MAVLLPVIARHSVVAVMVIGLGAYFLTAAIPPIVLLITSLAAYRLRAETGSRASVLIIDILMTVVVLVVYVVQTLRTGPVTFVAIIAILCMAIILDLMWSRARARRAAAAG